jgi:hypothetical protein
LTLVSKNSLLVRYVFTQPRPLAAGRNFLKRTLTARSNEVI